MFCHHHQGNILRQTEYLNLELRVSNYLAHFIGLQFWFWGLGAPLGVPQTQLCHKIIIPQ